MTDDTSRVTTPDLLRLLLTEVKEVKSKVDDMSTLLTQTVTEAVAMRGDIAELKRFEREARDAVQNLPNRVAGLETAIAAQSSQIASMQQQMAGTPDPQRHLTPNEVMRLREQWRDEDELTREREREKARHTVHRNWQVALAVIGPIAAVVIAHFLG